ncbi:MAG: manganese efflux pump MntP family protein [Anaerovoracaceae bacterium]|jgi:putative Mn2+ efflux pump MntP
MGTLTLVFIALGLAMDAFAVAVSNGICYSKTGIKEAIYMALTFGIFQAVMPVVGFFAGSMVSHTVEALDHWLALILLSFIGGNMIREGIKGLRKPSVLYGKDICHPRDLFIQGVATSIDALVIGISFAIMDTDIFKAAAIIGMVTFACSYGGVFIGKAFGSALKEKAEIFGGIILVLIGFKIFIEHIVDHFF